MGERDKELPGSRHKRSSDSSDEQNPDISNKRLRLELGSSAEDRLFERRLKNKEAAEKSRKKKKEEFTKIQTENDQLQQDKCQLVAHIEGLKADLSKVSKENNVLRYKIDHLKRWIGKHARDLGLGKHMQRNRAHEESRGQDRSREDLLWGDPSLYSTTVSTDQEQDSLVNSTSAPISSSSPPISSSAIPSLPSLPLATSVVPIKSETLEHVFLPVGVRTINFSAERQLPLAVETIPSTTESQREAKLASGQQLVYLPKDAIIMVSGECGPQLMMAAPHVQQEGGVDTAHVHHVHKVSSSEQQTSVKVPEIGTKCVEVQCKSAEAPQVKELGAEVTSPRKKSVESTEVQETTVEVSKVQKTSVPGPDVPHTTVPARDSVCVDSPENSLAAKSTTESTKNESMVPDASPSNQLSLASTIDALLKMGYTIQLPDGSQIQTGSQTTPAGNDV